jgi:hypothetical protein
MQIGVQNIQYHTTTLVNRIFIAILAIINSSISIAN